jgi:hypothetical protein
MNSLLLQLSALLPAAAITVAVMMTLISPLITVSPRQDDGKTQTNCPSEEKYHEPSNRS